MMYIRFPAVWVLPGFKMYFTYCDTCGALSIIAEIPFGLATMDVALIYLYWGKYLQLRSELDVGSQEGLVAITVYIYSHLNPALCLVYLISSSIFSDTYIIQPSGINRIHFKYPSTSPHYRVHSILDSPHGNKTRTNPSSQMTKGYIQHRTMAYVQMDFNWLDIISGDNGSIDPRYASISISLPIYIKMIHRTLKVHQVVTAHQDETFRSEKQPSPQPSPQSSPRSSSSLDLRALGPLKLEHDPPIPRLISKSSLRRLHNCLNQQGQRRRFIEFRVEEEDAVSLVRTPTDLEYEDSFLPFCGALTPPYGRSSEDTCHSSSPSSSQPEPQWLALVIARVVSSKARKSCRALKKKFSR